MPLNIASHLRNIFALSEYLRDNMYASETHRTPTPTYCGTSDESSVSHVQFRTSMDEFHVFAFRDISALGSNEAFSKGLLTIKQRIVSL
jgi:hypothetical protein